MPVPHRSPGTPPTACGGWDHRHFKLIRDTTNVPGCDVDDKPTTVTERREGTRRPLGRRTALRPAGPEDVDPSPCRTRPLLGGPRHHPCRWISHLHPRLISPVQTPEPPFYLPSHVRQRNRHGCPSVATEHRVLQQRSAGLCDAATDAVANPLQQRLLQQRLLQQRSVRQRTAATRRNPLQQGIACCNSAQYNNTARCTTAQSDATEHCVLQQSTFPSLHSATRRRSCCGSAVQRCSLFCNSVAQQRNRFQCRAVSCSRPRPAV